MDAGPYWAISISTENYHCCAVAVRCESEKPGPKNRRKKENIFCHVRVGSHIKTYTYNIKLLFKFLSRTHAYAPSFSMHSLSNVFSMHKVCE